MTALLLLLTLALPAPTELPELRTATSRTFDNHDGTYTTQLHSGPIHGLDAEGNWQPLGTDGVIELRPQRSTYGTGHVFYNEAQSSYTKQNDTLQYSLLSYGSRWFLWRWGWAKFDVTPLPESSTVVGLTLHCYQYEYYEYSRPQRNEVVELTVDPMPRTAREILDGRGVSFAGFHADSGIGWFARELNDAAVAAIEDSRTRGWLAVLINPEYDILGYGKLIGYRDSVRMPYLEVVYYLPGTYDIRGLNCWTETWPVIAGSTATFKARFVNYAEPSDTFTVHLLAGTTLFDSMIAGPLTHLEEDTVTVTARVPLDSRLDQPLRAVARHHDDTDPSNDTATGSCWVFPSTTTRIEGFEDTLFPPDGWASWNHDLGHCSWYGATSQHARVLAGNRAAKCSLDVSENDDWLVTDAVFPEAGTPDEFGFFFCAEIYAGADSLEVWAMDSTGIPDTLGRLLATSYDDTTDFVPYYVNLDAYDGSSVHIGIRHLAGYWGVAYLDEVWFAVAGRPGVVEELREPCMPALSLFPNPATRRASINYSLPTQAGAELSVLDISGREVWTERLAGERTGTAQLPLLPAGVYLVRLQSASFTATEKLVVQR